MIRSRAIPMKAKTFTERCIDDVLQGWFAPTPEGYLDYLIRETEKRNKKLLDYIRVLDQQTGQPRFSAQADHIIPKSVWDILMPGTTQ